MSESASQHIDRHVFRRLNNFAEVGRFLIAWLLLMLVLVGGVVYQTRGLTDYYLSSQSTEGGVLNEGIVGTYTNPNPLFASSTVDLSVSKLLFNSILTYDDRGALVNDLAESVLRSEDGLSYSVQLRKDIFWHDGAPFTAKDVEYTYRAIQNPNTKSPYNVSWQGVKIEVVDEHLVKFTLPAALNSFTLSLTNGIVPAHILEKVSFEELRGSAFTSAPIGTGPFKYSQVVRIDDLEATTKRQRIELVRNDGYFKGKPGLEAFVVYALGNNQDLNEYLESKTIDAAVFNSYPILTEGLKDHNIKNIPLLAGTYLFFNMTRVPLDTKELRQALVEGIDVNALLSQLQYPVQKIDGPLLPIHTGYDRTITQYGYNLENANRLLDSLGWVRAENGQFREKEGKILELNMTTLENSDFAFLAARLQSELSASLGIKINIDAMEPAKLQQTLLQHNYELLLYGISLGVDPDVYAYWHSSQAVTDRFNLSRYKSDQADRALEAGRSRPDVALRAIKYKPFLEAWKADVPAVGLYEPPVFYVTESRVFNFEPTKLNSTPDRFYNVHEWEVLTSKQPLVKE
jgi:peptide/nickel transport system substrate-binding protein